MSATKLEQITEVAPRRGKTPRARQWAKALSNFTETVSHAGKALGVSEKPDQLSIADAINAKAVYRLAVFTAAEGADWPDPKELAPALVLVSKSVDDFQADIQALQTCWTNAGVSSDPTTGLPADGSGPKREHFLRRAPGAPITEGNLRKRILGLRK